MLIDVGRRQKHPTTTFHFPPAARFLFVCVCVFALGKQKAEKKRAMGIHKVYSFGL